MPRDTTHADSGDVLPVRRDLYFGGNWVAANGGHRETINPSTGESLGTAAEADREDVDRAVNAAWQAFGPWRATAPSERARMLRRVAAILRENADELALLDALDCGNPVRDMRGDAWVAANQLDFFAGLVTENKGDTLPMGAGVLNLTLREPLGVCARMLAYNHPLMFAAGKCAAPLASGNCVILKPAEQTPLSALRLMELVEDVFPPGVLNVVTGGRACGEALVSHPLVSMVTLIGSVETGRAVAQAAGRGLKKVLLELGGKNALIVCPDADVDAAAEGVVKGMNFAWCGQSCGSTSRVFAHESIHDALVERVVERVKKYRPGIATNDETNMGALISGDHMAKVLSYIEAGKQEGARVALGGGRPDAVELQRGFFVEPMVFIDVEESMTIAREEIFGPVLSILKWTNFSDMIAAVNSVEYGLTASIYTRDLGRAHSAASMINVGSVAINSVGFHFPGVPFGGNKASGIGREESIEELFEFTQLKNVNVSYGSEDW